MLSYPAQQRRLNEARLLFVYSIADRRQGPGSTRNSHSCLEMHSSVFAQIWLWSLSRQSPSFVHHRSRHSKARKRCWFPYGCRDLIPKHQYLIWVILGLSPQAPLVHCRSSVMQQCCLSIIGEKHSYYMRIVGASRAASNLSRSRGMMRWSSHCLPGCLGRSPA